MFLIKKSFITIITICATVFGVCDNAFSDSIDPGTNLSENRVIICQSNEYVAKCGNVVIGTNLLKGFFDAVVINTSPDYYDYSKKNNINNLREFFAGTKSFQYVNIDGVSMLAKPGNYIDTRNLLLKNICTPNTSLLSDFFTCAPCPNDGTVGSVSTLKINNDGTISDTDWVFHSFADCYEQKFSDVTGQYKYVNADNDSTLKCYTSIEIPGTTLDTSETHAVNQNSQADQ